jgi:hypothetical protein
MNIPVNPDVELAKRITDRLLDVLIRAGLILAMVMLCFRIFQPFLSLMVWALILAVTLCPLQRMFAAKLGVKQGVAATLIVIVGFVLIVVPTSVLVNSLGDSVHQLVGHLQKNTLEIPAPRAGVSRAGCAPRIALRPGGCRERQAERPLAGPWHRMAVVDRGLREVLSGPAESGCEQCTRSQTPSATMKPRSRICAMSARTVNPVQDAAAGAEPEPGWSERALHHVPGAAAPGGRNAGVAEGVRASM